MPDHIENQQLLYSSLWKKKEKKNKLKYEGWDFIFSYFYQ